MDLSNFVKNVYLLIKELGLLNETSNIYQQVNDTLQDVLQQQNDTLFDKCYNDEEINCLPCLYWLPN